MNRNRYGDQVDIKKHVEEWFELLQKNNAEDILKMNKDIEGIIRKYGRSLETNQIRKLYDPIVKAKTTTDMALLKHKIAYQKARSLSQIGKKNRGSAQNMWDIIEEIVIRGATNDDNLRNSKIIMEAIVAYHKVVSK